jgi:CHRD domain-containing protein
MKRLGLVLFMLALGGIAIATTAPAQTDATSAICHRTSSKTSPYTTLRVSGKALKAHLAHAADIFPVPKGGCPRTVLTPTSQGTALQVALVGEVEVPPGDPVATGTATVRLRAGQGQVCYRIAATNLPPAAAAHIHRGAAGVAGPVIIPLTTPNAAGTSSGCAAAARSLVASILKGPASFYVNVHTQEFPAGAIRGQLSGTSQDSFGRVFAVDLKGSTEPNAKGTAVIRIRKDAGMVCYRLHAENVTLPTIAAHIHRGGPNVEGPVVVPFTEPGASGTSDGCATAAAALIDEIIANPAGFYVNVHTKEHPDGAIRAQLG